MRSLPLLISQEWSVTLTTAYFAALQKAFDSFDTDGKGYITPETVGVILRMMGVKISEKNLQEVIAETDEDGSGELEFEEFVELAAKFLIEEDEEALKEELREAFRIYDKEGKLSIFCNGYITTNTLKEILRELDNRLTEEDLEGIIEEVDEDGSGTLDFDGEVHGYDVRVEGEESDQA
ncbi:hypothetical protein Pcinc_035633 [Petrolisthes cinctipes]|uniref:EF-hand domain-containing protein n=1 Tax=Petrolisthes cinctipes TaxID=88211 RepID=A0AAE1BW57_PETCI|nr:hypothetical protein Pcinc_035633 [Petrolisthes cinctipes]